MRRLFALVLAIAVTAGVTSAWAAAGTLDLGPPWGAADQTDANRVELSYAIKSSGNVPQEAVDAVHAGIDGWNAAIDGRESGWELDLVPLDGASTSSSSGGRPSFHHQPDHGNGGGNGNGGGGNGGGNGEDPDISIHLKKGGGMIAGSAQRTVEDGFVVAAKIQISGSAFGLENDPETVEEVAMHELGHVLGLGHHSNEEDLMGPTVGYEGGGPSACDLDGFEKAHEWLTADLGANGAYRTDATSIECAGESPPEDGADMSIEKVADPDPATAGEALTYTITASNDGPDAADAVQVEDTLPAEVDFESASSTQGTCTGTSTVTCDVGSLAQDGTATVTIEVTPTDEAAEAGEITNTAAVESDTPDPDEANNQAQVTTSVEGDGGGAPQEPECDAAWCPIQPGALLGDAEAGFCTMGFLFRDQDSGRLLVSTAAHCTESVGEGMHAEAEEESFEMQEDAFGTVTFREDDLDFALIEVDEGREAETSASVRHWTGPDGVARTGDTSVGDEVMYYGYGVAFDLTPELRPRQGVLTQHTEEEYQSNSAGMQGDSGAAVLHEDGGALGLISRFNVVEDGVSTDLGPTVEGMLSFLDASGRDVALVGAEHAPPPPLLPSPLLSF